MTAAGSAVATVVLAAVVPPWRIPWHLLAGDIPFGGGTAPGWALAAWLILVSTVAAYLAGVAAVHRLSAPVAGAVAYIEAVAAAVFAWLLLGEHLGPVQIAGRAIVLACAFVAQRSVAPAEPIADTAPLMEVAGVRRSGG